MTQAAKYDLFISYVDADRAWVEGYLLDSLKQAGVRYCSEAAFAPGTVRLLEFERAIQQSQRILLVLSPAYLADGFNHFIDLLAQYYGLETGTWQVIPLILQPVKLPPRLSVLVSLSATNPDEWEDAIARLCTELKQSVPSVSAKPACPYPGMTPFDEDNSDRFFGRDAEVEELLECLRLHPFITVIGPSGSGKSSLVFAGLIPALRRSGRFGSDEWLVRVMRPGETPTTALETALGGNPAKPEVAVREALATQPNARRLLLVVNQFEEVFTLAGQEALPFQKALLRLVEAANCHVVLTVRADFYPDLMESPALAENSVPSAGSRSLDDAGLRQAIVRPAEDMGVFVEAALVERLVTDAAGEPGVLPLVQETLVLLWERVERRFLPLRAYEALVLPRKAYGGLGSDKLTGLQVAIARRADAALADLSEEQQAIARRIFLRLIQFGEGRPDTRRQQSVDALQTSSDSPAIFDQTLRHLAECRLLTLDGEEKGSSRKADIAHEALISGWPRLKEWLDERRQAEQERRRLEEKAAEWVRLGRGSGGLLDADELSEAKRWLSGSDVTDLGCSNELLGLVEASQFAIAQAKLKTRIITLLGAGLALFTLAAGGFAWQQQRQSLFNRQILSVLSDGITPENSQSLARKLPDFLKQANKYKQDGNVVEALANYRQILALANKLQQQTRENPQKFQSLLKEQSRIRERAEIAENSLVELIRQYRLPQLEAELSKGNFGELVEGDFSKFENQYTGALRTTYAILLRELGVKADLNNDGYLTEGEETALPCETLKDIETLWREFTQGHCGWYGSNSIYEEPKCGVLDKQTLTVKLSFPPSIYLLERRLSEQCNVVPVPKSAIPAP